MAEGTMHSGSSPMAAVFIFAMMTLTLLPYTVWLYYREPPPEQEVKLWKSKEEKVKKGAGSKKADKSFVTRIRENLTIHNAVLVLLYAFYIFLLVYINLAFKDNKPFDPYEILGVARDATTSDIRRAWRKLSLIYHPDKNPDPKAEKYFTEHISKAYKALTDETARKNWEEYGHPDGPQGINIGVALPEWLFTKDKNRQPIVLLGVLLVGFVLPVVLAVRYLNKEEADGALTPGSKKSKSGKPMSETAVQTTIARYFHPPYGLKQQTPSSKILETMTSSEILREAFPVAKDQQEHIAALFKRLITLGLDTLKSDDLKERPNELRKCHLLLAAHLERKLAAVPPQLMAEWPRLVEEVPAHVDLLLYAARHPRQEDRPYSWWTPYLSVVEFSQCLFQAVPPTNIKTMAAGRREAAGGGDVAMLQLPGFSPEVIRKLAKVDKVKTIKELASLPPPDRHAKLLSAGVPTDLLDDVDTMLGAMPEIHAAVAARGIGPSGEVYEEMPFVVVVQFILTRRMHADRRREGLDWRGRPLNSRALKETEPASLPTAVGYAPHWPAKKEERWLLAVGIPDTNMFLGGVNAALAATMAENVGFLAGDDVDPAEVLSWDNVLPQKDAPGFSFGDTFSVKGKEAGAGGAKRPALSKGFLNKVAGKATAGAPSSAEDASRSDKAAPSGKDGKGADGAAGGKDEESAGEATDGEGKSGAAAGVKKGKPLVKDLGEGQTMEIKILAPPKPGTYEVAVHLACDMWLGVDVTVMVPLTVRPKSQLERDVKAFQDKAEAEEAEGGKGEGDGSSVGDSGSEAGDASSDDEDREAPEDYESSDGASSDSDSNDGQGEGEGGMPALEEDLSVQTQAGGGKPAAAAPAPKAEKAAAAASGPARRAAAQPVVEGTVESGSDSEGSEGVEISFAAAAKGSKGQAAGRGAARGRGAGKRK